MTSPQYALMERSGHVATITLNRPDKLNAFTTESLATLRDAVLAADDDPEVRCIVVTGSGRAFSAGADVNRFKEAAEETRRTGVVVPSVHQATLEGFAVSMARMGTPIIAAINGPALGLGFTFALACDIRIASDRATLGATFVRMGLTPEFGSTFNLVHLVGIARACELVFNAKTLTAQEAREYGLVNQVVPHEQLMPVCMEMAQNIASLPPIAMHHAKRNLYSGLSGNIVTQARMETGSNWVARGTQDHLEAASAFVEKRKPTFRGR